MAHFRGEIEFRFARAFQASLMAFLVPWLFLSLPPLEVIAAECGFVVCAAPVRFLETDLVALSGSHVSSSFAARLPIARCVFDRDGHALPVFFCSAAYLFIQFV